MAKPADTKQKPEKAKTNQPEAKKAKPTGPVLPSKRSLVKALKSAKVSRVKGKTLAKCDALELNAKALELKLPIAVDNSKPAKAEPKKSVSAEDIVKQDANALIQKAMAAASAARKQGEKDKAKITKKRKSKGVSVWVQHLEKLLSSDGNKDSKTGVYTFSVDEVLSITDLEMTRVDKNQVTKLCSWVGYGGDWRPSYPGVGKHLCKMGFVGSVSSSPGSKGLGGLDKSKWSLKIVPVDLQKQLDLMLASSVGKKNPVYSDAEIQEVRDKIAASK
jgi:hypothetical protein